MRLSRGIRGIDTVSNNKKQEIRRKILSLRNKLPILNRTKTDREIILKLSELREYKEADVIFCFVGVKNEIDTIPFILKAIQSGKRICAPRCIADETMEAYEITCVHDLGQGTYGLLEPGKHCRHIDASEIDLAVIPCLACDRTGHRVGYGYGYYDKYMVGKGFCKVVLCREQAVIDKAPADSNDVPADIVITEKQVVRTGNEQ